LGAAAGAVEWMCTGIAKINANSYSLVEGTLTTSPSPKDV
jgi:hypothetical protein